MIIELERSMDEEALRGMSWKKNFVRSRADVRILKKNCFIYFFVDSGNHGKRVCQRKYLKK